MQAQLLRKSLHIRIATTPEFAARVLAPQLQELRGQEDVRLAILSHDAGSEGLLLSGQADIGIDCGRPESPDLRFKAVLDEPFRVVYSPRLTKRSPRRGLEHLLELPHLRYRRAPAEKVLRLSEELPLVFAEFNSIAAVREAATAGLGWAVLPSYTVQHELDSGSLRALSLSVHASERFGVWWRRDQRGSDAWVQRCIDWLGRQRLG
jgi:DNA-binding transcriptional LysR family regulator